MGKGKLWVFALGFIWFYYGVGRMYSVVIVFVVFFFF